MDNIPDSTPDTPAQPPFAARFAHFMTRTSTQYAHAPLSTLSDRGIENRLLNNLVEFLPGGAIIAGGFLTSVITEEDKSKDIDMFFLSEAAFRDTIAFLTKGDAFHKENGSWAYAGYTIKGGKMPDLDKLGDLRFLVFEHPSRPALQLLRMVWYDSAEHVIDTFDLTLCQFAVTQTGITYNPMAWIDLSRKRIVMHRCQFPASTLRRIIKYAHKGFYACPGSLAKICEEIQKFQGAMDANAVVYVD
jgi:hypothetical protein